MSKLPGRFFRVPTRAYAPVGNETLPAQGYAPHAGRIAPGSDPAGQPIELTDKQSVWQSIPFTVGTSAVKIQEQLFRKFFMIQNKSPISTMYVGFGWVPDALNGLVLGPGVGYEPYTYPVNEIWVVGTQASMSGLLIYGV